MNVLPSVWKCCMSVSKWRSSKQILDSLLAARDKRTSYKLNIISCAVSGIAPTHRRTSRTTRTGSKRRSTCCFAVRPSRQQSESSEGPDRKMGGGRGVWGGGGFNIIFSFCNLCLKGLSNLFWKSFFTKFLNLFFGGWEGGYFVFLMFDLLIKISFK